jgi:DNA invertase Pin-like site-specific DNA recombinase
MSVPRPASVKFHLPTKAPAIRAAAGKQDSATAQRSAALNRRRLRVLIYARYSTQEQDASSIEDQIAYCKKTLEAMGITDAEITILDDPEKSGELRNRPGIDKVWEGIKAPLWDLLIVEDASRLFRNESALMELAEMAFDNGMRIVCINDDVDSDEEGWRDRLRDAAKHHAKANYFTRKRCLRRGSNCGRAER